MTLSLQDFSDRSFSDVRIVECLVQCFRIFGWQVIQQGANKTFYARWAAFLSDLAQVLNKAHNVSV